MSLSYISILSIMGYKNTKWMDSALQAKGTEIDIPGFFRGHLISAFEWFSQFANFYFHEFFIQP